MTSNPSITPKILKRTTQSRHWLFTIAKPDTVEDPLKYDADFCVWMVSEDQSIHGWLFYVNYRRLSTVQNRLPHAVYSLPALRLKQLKQQYLTPYNQHSENTYSYGTPSLGRKQYIKGVFKHKKNKNIG